MPIYEKIEPKKGEEDDDDDDDFQKYMKKKAPGKKAALAQDATHDWEEEADDFDATTLINPQEARAALLFMHALQRSIPPCTLLLARWSCKIYCFP